MAKLLLTVFILTGCGAPIKEKHVDEVYVYDVKPIFQPYVDAFIEYSTDRDQVTVDHLTIEFGLLDSNILGKCNVYSYRSPKITINAITWDYLDETDREVLLFHELGHCILRRSHNPNYTGFFPDSIMHPNLISKSYKGNEEEYRDELYSIRNDWEESFYLTGNRTFICENR